MATADRDEVRRMVIKTGTGIATIPVSSDHRNGDWLDTDIYNGEYYMDTATGLIYTANADVIKEVGPPASAGIFGIATAGVYTYYTTIALANTAASSGDTIEMFGNVTEAGTTEWVLKTGVDYQLNGYTYEMSNAGTLNSVTDNAVAVKCSIFNGKIKRTGGTDSDINSFGLHIDSTTSEVFLYDVEVENDFGVATRTDGKMIGGRHYGYTKGCYVGLIQGVIFDAYFFGNTDNGISTYSHLYNCICESSSGVGGNLISVSQAQNCSFYSASSYGLKCNGAKVLNCSVKSDGNYGVHCNTGVNYFENCSFFSSANHGYYHTGSTTCHLLNCSSLSTSGSAFYFSGATNPITIGLTGISTTSYAFYSGDAEIYLDNCSGVTTAASVAFLPYGKARNSTFYCKWNNSTGHGVLGNTVSLFAEMFLCTIEVTNASANCLYNPNAKSAYYGNNIFKGATTSVNANITNSQTNTPDAYNNLVVG